MIVYSATRREFNEDVLFNRIEQQILDAFSSKLGHSTSNSEIQSWKNSLQYMNNVLTCGEIPDDAGVAIEYRIPQTSKRVDFILSGADQNNRDSVVIVELKQWSKVEKTQKDAIVQTFIGGSQREVTHPSYQAWTYAALIQDFNVEIQEGDILLHPCAYLHNCIDSSVVKSSFYDEHTLKAPVFLKGDVQILADFLKKYVRYGDQSKILYRIEHGKLRPSKNLADHLASLLKGNREFEMIDDQKIVYETALELATRTEDGGKQVLLVEGGPGTGKSVVAINLLVEYTKKGLLTHYVSRNAAPRAVYESKLSGTMTKTRITNLFKGSGAYINSLANALDCLIVDEAHRLNAKSGFFHNQGENQIKEIIHAAKFSIFFLDQDQRVTLKDIGERAEIRRHVAAAGAELTELKLESQFRCNGSDGYLSWVNSALQIEETANPMLAGIDYDFRVFDSPNKLREEIFRLNNRNDKSRMVAGYCWDWKGKKHPDVKDVTIPEHGFEMRWNLDKDSSLWIITLGTVSEIGCIHTCQGLELDYVGVVVGEDLVIRNGMVVTDALKRSRQDSSVHGYKSMLKKNPDTAKALADRIIKNTYRTLMTRGQKGCFLFCVDAETNAYFRNFVYQTD
ncbi:MAG: DUF2075 domain-containing protein [Gammaproteobacteria bacterium]|nr:DUF2075 domain-containing protein [Gammaproteobacteria bacterium]